MRESTIGARLAAVVPHLRRWAHGRLPRWARGAADTTDLIHDAVLRTLGRGDAVDARTSQALAAYLREAVRNRIRDEYRRVARHGVPTALPAALADRRRSPLEQAIDADADRRYRSALARLTPADRELVVAHLELDYTHDQLACMTGRSRNAARMALHRAIRRLAAQIREA